MEVERAISALDEVRVRLASCQRYRGYSGPAVLASGVVAVGVGLFQGLRAPHPHSEAEIGFYLHLWLSCLVVALVLNYGAVLVWHYRSAALRERRQAPSVALAIVPSMGLGAILSWALLRHGLAPLLPGVWYVCYGTGLLSSRSMLPPRTVPIALGFCFSGAALLLVGEPRLALAWWVMPIGFGVGQMAIGGFLIRDGREKRAER